MFFMRAEYHKRDMLWKMYVGEFPGIGKDSVKMTAPIIFVVKNTPSFHLAAPNTFEWCF